MACMPPIFSFERNRLDCYFKFLKISLVMGVIKSVVLVSECIEYSIAVYLALSVGTLLVMVNVV